MIAASVLALTLASLASAAPVSSSAEEYVSTYVSASSAWTSRFANATYTADATVTVAETTVTVTYTPTSTAASSSSAAASSSSSTSEWVAPSSSAVASSSTSEWVAPSSSSSESKWVAPSSSAAATTSSAAVYQAVAVEKTSSAAATTSAAASNSGSFSGTATYFYQGGNAGSCGNVNSDSAYIVAVNSAQVSGTCGKTVVITNTKNGKTVPATCADTCPTCDYGSLDLSEGLFSALGNGDMGQGVFPITWSFA